MQSNKLSFCKKAIIINDFLKGVDIICILVSGIWALHFGRNVCPGFYSGEPCLDYIKYLTELLINSILTGDSNSKAVHLTLSIWIQPIVHVLDLSLSIFALICSSSLLSILGTFSISNKSTALKMM